MEKTITVERHNLGVRITHWLQVVFMLTLIITGYGIYSGSYIIGNAAPAFGYFSNFGLHMVAAAFLLATNLILLLYFLAVDDDIERQIVRLKDITNIIKITLNFVGVKKEYPPLHSYDLQKKEWTNKYHPMQKFFLWLEILLIVVAALAGYAMFKILYYGEAGILSPLGFLAQYLSIETLKAVHFTVFLFFVAILPFHIYLALIPVNWNLLKAMVFKEYPARVEEK